MKDNSLIKDAEEVLHDLRRLQMKSRDSDTEVNDISKRAAWVLEHMLCKFRIRR